ncbi:acyl-CoA dehydrogenase [Variibacter gotjawalensis]|uniref:Acyl-[acyl-carrier-protein] dehydrogenase MbtN n=1 Tax=Variibacter gotjawalensis TaxID=1333996 RepID=A0A0S3PZN2_9BRAD|nr:acyl-CoA dehydrogenase family protein [Variibacter gotjawalensis]NIK47229.1 acyl-CoA dehydrogenase [Variibacter gotjawalensis]RZS49129.1 acyl-CoA dehydrogenase [Variibacter gotjawalensis]BAT61391.1 acyl-CoA dehydrogenase [Variibacter gotjawalensis]
MIPRQAFTEEHDMFRATVRKFVEREVAPYHAQWEKDGQVSREVWLKAGETGILCTAIPEEYGGGGGDFRHVAIVSEEFSRGIFNGPGFRVHSDICAFYLLNHGSEEQKKKWLPKMATGEVIAAVAMTEPGAGSDLQNIRTTALRDDNQNFVINGSKTFISNGQLSDLIITVCKTDPQARAKGVSLILVESDRPGFKRGRNLEKLGMHAQDTSELFYDDCRVPIENLLGQEGRGFAQLMTELPQERLLVALASMATTESVLETTLTYTRDRKVFGQPIAEYQHNRFKLAEMKTEIQIGRVFLDRCLELHLERKLDTETAAMAKYWISELECRVVDQCVQMHGGYGYMTEYPVTRAYADARVRRIFGGSNEIMRELIARGM